MFTSPLLKPTLAMVALVVLMGCKSDADRADEYFQSGQELVASGDLDRALVQFRNVFEFDAAHRPTRIAMAEIFMERGNLRGAYQQYLAIAEQFPDDFESRLNLSELAFGSANWDEFERHGTVAIELSPEEPRVQAIDLGMKYRTAAIDDDAPARQALVPQIEALLESLPNNAILNNLLIDSYSRDGTPGKALERLDAMVENNAENRQLYMRRLALLVQVQDNDAIGDQLRNMVEVFPGDEEIQDILLRFYLSQRQVDEAETFLREIADPAAEDPSRFLSLIRFVGQVHGEESARKEIARAIAENPNPDPFKAMLAMLDFQAGDRDEAIATMEGILAEKPEDADPQEVSPLKVTLARMLVGTGNQVGARQLVEEVLTEDVANVEALKMQASWQIQADDTDGAIANLRLALDAAPEDVQAMNLMYEAYTRTGETDLARDFLALAVDASGNSPETSVRYARVLMQEERYLPAEDVLLPSLQLNPGNTELLSNLGTLYLAMEDIPRLTQVVNTLERLETDEATGIATRLRAAILNSEDGVDEAMKFLEELASGEDADLQAKLTLLQARLSTGKTAEALTLAQELVAENPDNLGLKQALARTQVVNGDFDTAKATLREVTSAAPVSAVSAWLQISQIMTRQGDTDGSKAVILEAIEATNSHPNLMWAHASILEREGDYDGAIGVYEDLYARNSSWVVVANNLASMLTTYRDDPESLERAWVIARRLRDSELPAFQDTYGWIAFRRGEIETSLPYLERAAAGLPNDPIVQVHLGLNYAALERNEEALAQLQKAVEVAGPADTRDRIEQARAEITRLRGLSEN